MYISLVCAYVFFVYNDDTSVFSKYCADGRSFWMTFLQYFSLLQVEMTGSSIFDYIHHQDHTEIAEQLGLGLSQGQNLASPGSGSEESTSTAGTNNPDGNIFDMFILL